MPGLPTPIEVTRGLASIGDDLRAWRALLRLTRAEVAERAGVGISTVQRLEGGEGASLENLLCVARGLGILESVLTSFDPYETEVGRLRAAEGLPRRVRHPKIQR